MNVENPFFSVIIPLYNKEKYINNTIESVLNQRFTNFEILVVNDGSTDNSLNHIKLFSDSRIKIFNQKNQGVSVARNFGIEQSKGKYICFLDADDYWYSHFLSQNYKYIELLPEQKVFTSAFEFETKNKIIPCAYSMKKTGDYQIVDYFEVSQKKHPIIWTSSSVFHKSVFQKSGVFDVRFHSGQDSDLWIRVGLHFPVVFIWKIASRYVYDPQGISRNRKKINEKPDYSQYISLEKDNPKLKRFLDRKRSDLAIKNKLCGNKVNFNKLYNQINLKNLSLRKKILLHIPVFILVILIAIKNNFLTRLGLTRSVF